MGGRPAAAALGGMFPTSSPWASETRGELSGTTPSYSVAQRRKKETRRKDTVLAGGRRSPMRRPVRGEPLKCGRHPYSPTPPKPGTPMKKCAEDLNRRFSKEDTRPTDTRTRRVAGDRASASLSPSGGSGQFVLVSCGSGEVPCLLSKYIPKGRRSPGQLEEQLVLGFALQTL